MVSYASPRQTRGHNVTASKLAMIKKSLAGLPRGSVVDGSGRCISRGNGIAGSGRRSMGESPRRAAATRSARHPDVARCLAQAERFLSEHLPVRERIARIRAAVAAKFATDDD